MLDLKKGHFVLGLLQLEFAVWRNNLLEGAVWRKSMPFSFSHIGKKIGVHFA